jgi:predicted phage terminase large subunit-like protein
MNASPKMVINNLLRTRFDLFFRKVFAELNPGIEYIPAPHVALICDRLQRIEAGEFRRLLIAIPPRYLKSTIATVGYIAWKMGRDPSLKVLLASYGQDLANKLARDIRAIVSTTWYREAFPRFKIGRGKNTEAEVQTSANGYLKAVSVEGGVTGYGADLIVFDDPIKVGDADNPNVLQRARNYFDQSLFPRLNDKHNGIVLVVQQRLHREDLVGHLIEKGTFELLSLPAIAIADENYPLLDGTVFRRRQGEALHPARDTLEGLATIRRGMDAAPFEAQYQQDPTAFGGGYVDWMWFRVYDARLPRHEYRIVQSWDFAGEVGPNNDYSVGMAFGLAPDGSWHLVDLLRGKWVYPKLLERVAFFRQIWRPEVVVVERAGLGLPMFHALREQNYPVVGLVPRSGKIQRFQGVTGRIEAGELRIPREAPWLTEFRREMLDFPNGAHDDQIDALSQFFYWARNPDFVIRRIEEKQYAAARRRIAPPYRRPSLRERIENSYNPDTPTLVSGGI